MNIALWIVQDLLAALFTLTGVMQIAISVERMTALLKSRVYAAMPPSLVKIIGALELLGVLGLTLPAWTGVLPWLTPLAAVCLALLMVGALTRHWRLRELWMVPVNVMVIAAALFVAYGYFIAHPL